MSEMPKEIWAWKPVDMCASSHPHNPPAQKYHHDSIVQGIYKSADIIHSHLDLMVDEFKRIKACPNISDEVKQLCDRAIAVTKQNVPLIRQRDDLQANNTKLVLENRELKSQVEQLLRADDAAVNRNNDMHDIITGLNARIATLEKQLEGKIHDC